MSKKASKTEKTSRKSAGKQDLSPMVKVSRPTRKAVAVATRIAKALVKPAARVAPQSKADSNSPPLRTVDHSDVASIADRSKRSLEILARLKQMYPDAHCSLQFRNALELLVATILSAQCTDQRVNMVTPALFKTYKSAADFAKAPIEQLESAIQSTGFYRNKARSIQAMARTLVEKYGGKVPAEMDQLVELAGVGRKTANVVLGNAYGINEGVVVDTHVGRITLRMDLSRGTDPIGIEQDLIPLFPRNEWTLLAHLLIYHGRAICQARKPLCASCKLADLCPKIGVPDKPAE